MNLPSNVQILYDGGDITADVLPSETNFEDLMNAMPGLCNVVVRDRDQTHSFVTGKELILRVDGVDLWGGHVTNKRMRFAFPVVDTVSRPIAQVKERQWVLVGVSFNTLFDRRVVRNPADFLHQLPNFDSEDFDGALIREALVASKYIDVPAGFDVTTEVDDTTAYRAYHTLTSGAIADSTLTVTVDSVDTIPPFPFYAVIKDDPVAGGNREIVQVTGRSGNILDIVRGQQGTLAVAHGDNSFFLHLIVGAWVQQGSAWRQLMEDFVQFSGAVYYISADKKVHHHSLEDVEARWGFSDVPNKQAVTASPASYQGATIGFREIDAVEDGSVIVNDALIWGGSEWSGDGQTVFARRENVASQNEHNRWQIAEVHFGEQGFRTQKGVDARAKVIVDGEPGSVGGDPNRGLRFPQWDISLSWYAKDVPRISGVPDHLRAGQLVRIILNTFGTGGVPLEQILPLRRLSITFPARAEEANTAWVKFQGTFSLQLSDPFTLWRYLLKVQSRSQTRIVSSVDGSNPAPYGSIFSGAPVPSVGDGSLRVFDLPDDRGYIAGTTEVYLDPGTLQRRGIDYVESDPDLGQITFVNPPALNAWVWVVCRSL